MRILYHHRTQGRGAEGVHITSLVRALETLGHLVDLVSPPGVDPRAEAGSYLYQKSASKEEGKIRLLWRFLSRHAPQIVFEFAELCYNFVGLTRLVRRSKGAPVDLIYERHAFYLWAGAFFARWNRLPFILEINEISGVERAREQIGVWLAQRIELCVCRSADTIVVVSSFLKETLVVRGVDTGKIVVVPNGVDHKRFHPERDASEIRRGWGFENRVIFGFVGWFDPWDKLPFLIDVFEDVYRVRPEAALTLVGNVVGGGPGLHEIRKEIERRGLDKAIMLTGAVIRDRMPQTIAAMDVGVIPHSNSFGSPVVLFEYMASGKPVIAPFLGPIQDVLRHCDNGILFQPEDRVELKEAFLYLIDNTDERDQIGVAARRSILKEHTWETKALAILDFHAKREKLIPKQETKRKVPC